MRDRILARIDQLEQEREDLRIGAMLRDREIVGQIQALRDVLVAIETDQPQE